MNDLDANHKLINNVKYIYYNQKTNHMKIVIRQKNYMSYRPLFGNLNKPAKYMYVVETENFLNVFFSSSPYYHEEDTILLGILG